MVAKVECEFYSLFILTYIIEFCNLFDAVFRYFLAFSIYFLPFFDFSPVFFKALSRFYPSRLFQNVRFYLVGIVEREINVVSFVRQFRFHKRRRQHLYATILPAFYLLRRRSYYRLFGLNDVGVSARERTVKSKF